MAEILHFEILRKHGQTNTHTHTHTNKQTHRHGHYNTSPSPYGGEVIRLSRIWEIVHNKSGGGISCLRLASNIFRCKSKL